MPKRTLDQRAQDYAYEETKRDIEQGKRSIFREMFGALKNVKPRTSKSTDEILKEMDEEDEESESRFE